MLPVARKVRVTAKELLPALKRNSESRASIRLRTGPTPTRGAAVNLARIVAMTNGGFSQHFYGTTEPNNARLIIASTSIEFLFRTFVMKIIP